MKQTILGISRKAYCRTLCRHISLCTTLAATTLILNVLLSMALTEENRTFLLLFNAGSDALCGSFLIYYSTCHISRQQKLYHLSGNRGIPCQGIVTGISKQTIRYMDLDCLEVTVGNQRLFLPHQTISLEVGTYYHFLTTSGIIMEAVA